MLLETRPRQNHPKIRYFFDFGETHDTMIPENIEKKICTNFKFDRSKITIL